MNQQAPSFLDSPLPSQTKEGASSRREFLAATASLLLTGATLRAEKPLHIDELQKEENEQRLKMVEQSASVIRKNDPRLAIQWPENTAVYAATVQTWPAWPDIHTDNPYFFQEIKKNFASPEVDSLDQAARMLKNGWCWPYIPYTPQVPTFTAAEDTHSGWRRSQDDKKRYVLVLSGEGSRSSSDDYQDSFYQTVREELNAWSKKHPLATHQLDPRFISYLKDKGLADAADQYKHSLKEEKRFLDGGIYLKDVLAREFNISNDRDHVRVLAYPRLAEVEDAFKSWVDKRQGEDCELAVIYNGHGILKQDVDDSTQQGLAEGVLCINNNEKLTEAELKKLFRKHASGFRAASILIDACHSGAFVA